MDLILGAKLRFEAFLGDLQAAVFIAGSPQTGWRGECFQTKKGGKAVAPLRLRGSTRKSFFGIHSFAGAAFVTVHLCQPGDGAARAWAGTLIPSAPSISSREPTFSSVKSPTSRPEGSRTGSAGVSNSRMRLQAAENR